MALKAPWGAARQLVQAELGLFQGQFAGLDLGQVQQVVQDRQQRLSGLLDDPHPLLLGGRQGLASQDLGHAKNPVERGADFMAHGGQEGAFGRVGGFGVFLGADEGLFGPLLLGDVAHGAQQADGPPLGVGPVVRRALDPDFRVIRPLDPILGAEGDAFLDMPAPQFVRRRTIPVVDHHLGVQIDVLIGLRPHEEAVFRAGLEQFAAAIVQLEHMHLGQAERHVQPRLVALQRLHRLDQRRDVVRRDDDAGDVAPGVGPGRHLALQELEAAVRKGNLDPLAGEALALHRLGEGGGPALVEAAGDLEDVLADDGLMIQLQTFGPKLAAGRHAQVLVGHDHRQGQGADQLGQGGPGVVPFGRRFPRRPRGLGARPFVGQAVGQMDQAGQPGFIQGLGRRPGRADDAGDRSVRQADRRGGVEARERRTHDIGIFGEPRIEPAVLDPQGLAGGQDQHGARRIVQSGRDPAGAFARPAPR